MPHIPGLIPSLLTLRLRFKCQPRLTLVVLLSDGLNQSESISNESNAHYKVRTQRLSKKEAFMMLNKRNIGLVIVHSVWWGRWPFQSVRNGCGIMVEEGACFY